MPQRILKVADLYCGAGGFSEGLEAACEKLGVRLHLVAINHSPDAIETHLRNHPEAIHLCADLDSVDPLKIVPGKRLDLLIASPECTHHSNARGGKPRDDQSRMQPFTVVTWASKLYISTLIVENVKEFEEWGPLDAKGNPIESKKGELFIAWLNALKALNYRVEYRKLNAMHYGSASSRERLFVIAHRGSKKITWPEPTHGEVDEQQPRLFGNLKPLRTARDIIDLSLPGESIFGRKKPLSDSTLRRIEVGLRKFCGISFAAVNPEEAVFGSLGEVKEYVKQCDRGFVLPNEGYYGGNQPRALDEQIPTVVAGRGAGNLVIVQFNGQDFSSTNVQPASEPLRTIPAQGNHFGLAEPFVVRWDYKKEGEDPTRRVFSSRCPLPTLMTKASFGVVHPEGFVLNVRGGKDGYTRGETLGAPLQTITTQNPMSSVLIRLCHEGDENGALPVTRPMPVITTAQDIGVSQFLVKLYTGSDAIPITAQVPTITANYEHVALTNAFLTQYHGASYPGGERVAPISAPLPTVATSNQYGFVLPFLVKYYGQSVGQRIDEPIGTLLSKDHFGLVLASLDGTQQWLFDILFRMLQPHELAAAMSFPPKYFFFGTAKKKKYQIEKRGQYFFQGPGKVHVRHIGNAVDCNQAEALCAAAIKIAMRFPCEWAKPRGTLKRQSVAA
jgi:DNA (cytosine-5)-methyltransferase 1